MKVIVNGSEYSFNNGVTLLDIIKSLKISSENIVAEVNGEVVTKDDFANKIVTENSIIELVRFVGGG